MASETAILLPYLHKDWEQIVMKLNGALRLCLDFSIVLSYDDAAKSPKPVVSRVASRGKDSDPVESIRNALRDIFVSLQSAHKLIAPDDEEGDDEELGVFCAPYEYYAAKCSRSRDEVKHVNEFVTKVLPCIIKLVLEFTVNRVMLPVTLKAADFYKSTHSCIKRYEHAIPRKDVASVLAAMFLCLIRDRPSDRDDKHFPLDFDYSFIFFSMNRYPFQLAKFLMVLDYFKAIADRGPPLGMMRFRHLVGTSLPKFVADWGEYKETLCRFEIFEKGTIEDNPSEVIQADFANEYIGGGVLLSGRVQEEIRFFTAPELQVSMLFCERMEANEAIHMLGFESFSSCQGYADALTHSGFVEDPVKKSDDGSPQSYLTAIDAVSYGGNASRQYQPAAMLRELNKAFVGFLQIPAEDDLRPIATGNWGCGVFGGDPQFKSLLQWAAASQAGCNKVVYHTFKDSRVAEDQLAGIVNLLKKKSVGDLMRLLIAYSDLRAEGNKSGVFDFIRKRCGSTI